MRKKMMILAAMIALLTFGGIWAYSQDLGHINDLFDLRTSITNQGKGLPDLIRKNGGTSLRTLERIFELNTSALTTIEAYFRLYKMAVTEKEKVAADSVRIMNEWLSFMKNQCGYDIEYLKEALKAASDKNVIGQIKTAMENIERLAKIAEAGITENGRLLAAKK